MTDLAELGFSVNSKEIQGAIRALDNLDKAGDRVEKRGPKVGKGYEKSMMAASKATASFRGVLGELKGAIGILGFGAIVKSTLDYGSAIKEVSTLVDTATFDMAALSDEAIKQAKQYGVMPTHNVKAFYQAISAGAVTAEEATAAVDAANRLAIAGVTDVTTSIDGLTSVMNAYAGEAGSFTDISDAMFVAVRAGKTTVGELASNIGKVAPIAAQAGASLEEVLAATAALTKGGISTTESMTGLRAIMAAVVKPTKDATELAGELGLNFNAAGLESKGFAGFLQEVQDKTGGSTEKLAQLFGGVEALVPIMGLLADDSSEFTSILGQMEMKTGSAAEAFDKMTNSSAFQLKRIVSTITGGILEFTSALDQKAGPAIKVIADGLDSFVGKLKNASAALTGSAEFKSFVDSVKSLGNVISPVIPYLDDFAIALVAIGGGLAAIAAAKGFIAVVGTIGKLVGIGAKLNPLRLAIVGLALGATALMENWEAVYNWWQNTTWAEKAKDIGQGIVKGIKYGIGSLVKIFGGWIQSGVDWVKKKLGIQSPSKVFVEIGSHIVQGLANGISGAFSFIKQAFSNLYGFMVSAIKNEDARKFLAESFFGGVELLKKAAMFGGEIGLKLVGGLVSKIKKGGKIVADFLGDIDPSELGYKIGSLWASGIKGAYNFVSEAVGNLVEFVTDAISDPVAWNTAREFVLNSFFNIPKTLASAASYGAKLVGGLVSAVVDAFGESAGQMLDAAQQLASDLIAGMVAKIKIGAKDIVTAMRKVGSDIIDGLKDGIASKYSDLKSFISDKLSDLPLIGDRFGTELTDAMANAITSGSRDVRDALERSIIVDTFGWGGTEMSLEAAIMGGEIPKGLALGILSGTVDVEDAIKQLAEDGVILPFKDKTLIQSPSKLFMQFGRWIVEGLAGGIDNNKQIVVDVMTKMTSLVSDFGGGLTDTIADSFRNMDSLKDALRGVEDYTKSWLSDMTATFVENNLGNLFSKGVDMFGGLFSGGGKTNVAQLAGVMGGSAASGGGVGGLVSGAGVAGANPYLAAAAAGVTVLTKAVDNFEDFSKKGKRAALALTATLPGVGALATAVGGERLFGGKKKQTGEGFTAGFSGGEVSGQSFDTFSRRKSLFRGTDRTEENFRDLDSQIRKDIEQFFDTMLTSVSDGAEMLGISGADEIFSSFEVATKKFKGKNAEKQLQQWLEDSTRDAYELAFDKLGPELQMLIGNSVDMINAPIEELEGVFSEVGAIASVIAPQMNAVGITLSEAFGSAAVQASDLIDRMGGVESATRSLALYQSEFAGVQASNEAVLRMNRERLEEWNNSIGLSGGSIIDTRAEMVSFITTLDQTTTAGREATAAAFEQLEAIIAVEDAARKQAETFNTVSEAARWLNLNFDATSPTAMNAADSLVQLMGGLDQFRSATERYYNDFFSLEERQQMSLRDSTATVIAFNDAIGLSGASAIDSAAEFRNYVSSLDLTTQAGQRAYAQALAVSDSMKIFTDSGGDLRSVIHQLPGEMQTSLWSMLNAANDSASGIATASQTVLTSLGDAGSELWNFGNAANDSGNFIANAAQRINDSIRRIADLPSFNQTLNDPNLRDASVIRTYLENNPNTTRAELQNYLRFYRSQVSAEGGMGRVMYDGQLISAHKDEMVLPSHIADWIRDAANSSDNNAELAEQLDRVNQKLEELNERTARASESNMQGHSMVAAATESQTKEVKTHNKEQDRILRRLSQSGQAA